MLNYYRNYLFLLSIVSPNTAAKQAYQLFCTPINKKLREREVEVLKMASSENIAFENSFIKKYTWGAGNKKALLVHGWESNAGSLGAFVKLLNAHNYQVIAFDCPAHGQSGGKQTTLFKNTAAAALICNQIGHIDIAITHSFGSVVLMNALLQQNHLQLNKLIMITTPNEMQQAFDDFYRLLHIKPKVQRLMETHVENLFHVKIKDLNAAILCRKLAIDKALIIHDKNDQIIPYEQAERVAKNLKNCQLIPVENAGHYRILWHPEVIQLVEAAL